MPKKLIVPLVLLLFLALAGFFTLPMLINKETVKNQIVASFKLATGMDLLIQDKIDLEAFPLPHMIMRDLYVPNIPTASAPFLLTIKSIDIKPDFLSLFKGKMVINKLNANGVTVELERLKDGSANWRDTAAQTPSKVLTQQGGDAIFNASSIDITNAVLHFTDSSRDERSEYKNINFVMTNSGNKDESALRLTLEYRDRPFVISGSIGNFGKALLSGSVPARLKITSRNSHFSYDGEFGYQDARYRLSGKALFDTDDVVPWILLLSRSSEAPADPQAKPLPLQIKTDIATEGEKILLNNVALEGGVINGAAQVAFAPPYKVDLQASIAMMDIETIIGSELFSAGSKSTVSQTPERNSANNYSSSEKTLWNMLALDADVKVADAIYNGQHIKNGHFGFDMDAGEINISQASVMLPGQSRVVFTGIGRKGYQGVTLEGQVDAAGGDFVSMIKVFKSKGFGVPPEDFKRFRIKANAVISAKEARFSELVARIENMGFVGGVVATFGERTKLQTALRIGGVNLDHFIALWGLKAWESSFLADNPGQSNEEFLSHWLKQLSFDLEINASLEQYTLNGKLAQKTDFAAVAVPGKINVSDLKTFYNGSTLTGSIGLDVTGILPSLNMDMVADVLDTSVFFGQEGSQAIHSMARHARPGEFWSHAGFDFHWLDLLNSNYHVKIGRFRDALFEATNLDIKGNINNRTLTADAYSGEALGAKFDGKAVLFGGKIPALNLLTNIQDLDADRLVQILPVLEGMKGKFNINLQVNTSGIDMFTWVSNLNGAVGLAGSSILVHGFNLPGIVKAVSYVRTVANILNVVKRAFPGGDTLFSRVSGRWTIVNGVATASDTMLIAPDSDVLLECKADLVNWQINGQISFPLKSLDMRNPPKMFLNLSGNLDRPEKALDTRMLEEFVTSQTSEKMLKEYGH